MSTSVQEVKTSYCAKAKTGDRDIQNIERQMVYMEYQQVKNYNGKLLLLSFNASSLDSIKKDESEFQSLRL